MKPTRLRLIALFVVVLFNVSFTACSTLDSAGRVTVLAAWTGDEEKNFKEVLKPFEDETGIQVVYQGTRALNEDLTSKIQQGTQPDIAILGGELAQYQRKNFLHPLDDVIGPHREAYTEPGLEFQKLGTDNLYGVIVKANLKSIIWFNPNHLPDRKPETWDELVSLSQNVAGPAGTPWCLGMGDTPNSGWPGTDWIEDILLHQFGTESYKNWVLGKLPWTSPEVRKAWLDWRNLMAGSGSRSALLTDFADEGRPLFTNPPGCFLHHQPSFIIGFYQKYPTAPSPSTDFDFFPFPNFDSQSGDPSKVYEVTADMAAMFNNTPQARKLIQYLATEEAQEIWPKIPGSGAFSMKSNVDYNDDISRRIAETLTSADKLCYDASNLMPTIINDAFNRAALEYLSNPDQLDSLLEQLDQVQRSVPPEEKTNFSPC